MYAYCRALFHLLWMWMEDGRLGDQTIVIRLLARLEARKKRCTLHLRNSSICVLSSCVLPAHPETRTMLIILFQSTFTAALIVLLLALVDGIIGPRRRVAFSIGMLFSFMALSIHFANIFLAGRGAMLTTTSGTKRDIESLKFYLAICGNLQLGSTVLFLVSIAVMIFLIFSSIAFPLVLLFLSGIGALVVFTNAYWEIPITLANVQFLVANIGRLKSSLESLQRSARAARLRPSKT